MEFSDQKWFAIYVKSRCEKKAFDYLKRKKVESYVPLRKTLCEWSDRKKWVEIPIISGYLFVHADKDEVKEVFNAPGFISFVKYNGINCIIEDIQILSMKIMLQEADVVDVVTEHFEKGDYVEVIAGAMLGVKGEIIKSKNRHRILVRLNQIGYNIIAEVNKNSVKRIPEES